MHLSKLAVQRPVATGMLFIGILLLGLISLSQLSVDLLPNLAYPKLTVRTTCSDVGPQEIEELITRPVEEVLATIPGLRQIHSSSREGVSLVTTEFLWGTNMDFAMLNVREKLDQLRWSLPDEAGRPTIIQLDPRSRPILALSVSGQNLVQIKQLTRDVIKRRLEQLKGVALAQVVGGLEREIQVEVDLPKLTVLGLNPDQIIQAISAANVNLPGGTIKQGLFRFSLRTLGEFQSPDEIQNVVLNHTKDGHPILLRDVATVTDGFAERESLTRFNGHESIGVLILKESGANTVEVTRSVRQIMHELRAEYPEIELVVAFEQARFISEAIENLIQNIVYGGLLAFVVLLFFLQDFRQPTYIALSIPISIITTFVLLYFMDISLNIMSLGGLALAVGMLVDNSIVVLENIFRHQESGLERSQAAILGTEEVGLAVTAGTVTTIAVFLPVVYVYGVAGQLFREQAITVTFSLVASLVVALTLLPMLLAHFFVRKSKPFESKTRATDPTRPVAGFRKWVRLPLKWLLRILYLLLIYPLKWLWQEILFALEFFTKIIHQLFHPLFRGFNRGYEQVFQAYERGLEQALNHRRRVLVLTAGFVGLALLASPRVTRELMPRIDPGEFTISLKMPPGFTLQATAAPISQIEQRLLEMPDVEAVFTTIGLVGEQATGSQDDAALNRGKLRVRLKPARDLSLTTVMQQIRQFCQTLPDAETAFETEGSILQQILGTSAPPLAVKIQGHDLQQNFQFARQVRDSLATIAGLKDLHLDFDLTRPEILLHLNREAIGRLGLTASQVAGFIEMTVKGKIATYFKDFDRKISVWVRTTAENRRVLADIFNLQIPTATGHVPLRSLISAEERPGPTEVLRENQQRQIILYGQIQGAGFNSVITAVRQRLTGLELPEGTRITIGGEQEELQHSFRSLALALLLSVMLIYMVLAAQFESLKHPFIILLDVPVSACLTLLVLLMTGMSLNVISLIGFIVLAGVAVNDSIVKIDFINQARRSGTPLREAILLAGHTRFRAIVMTTVTTVVGLLPMALGFGEGAELQQPLAITVLGGIILSTLVSLFLVPVLYLVFERE